MKEFTAACGRYIREYIKETDRLLLLTCIMLSCLSVTLISGLVHAGALVNDRPLKMQLLASLVGLAAAIFISKFDYHMMAELWKLHQPIAYGLVFLTFTSEDFLYYYFCLSSE